MKYQQICFEESHNSHQSDNCPEQHSVVPTQSIYRVGALNWSILVFVRLAGNGVGAFDAKYGVMDGMEAENEEKYSAANWTTSSGFLSNRNWRKSANRFFSSGCERMYVVWSPFNSSFLSRNFEYSCISSSQLKAFFSNTGLGGSSSLSISWGTEVSFIVTGDPTWTLLVMWQSCMKYDCQVVGRSE